MTADNTAALRVRLIELRADALRRLAEAEMIDSGLMRVVADANAFSTARLNDDQGGRVNLCGRTPPPPARSSICSASKNHDPLS